MHNTRQVIVNDLAVSYTDTGQGPVVILLHGWGASATSFEPIRKVLAEHRRVVCLDLPGFGGSQQPDSDWFVADYAKFLSAFLHKIGVTKIAALAGHSFGGRVCIKAVASKLVEPAKLVLIDSGGIKESRSLRNRLFKAAAKIGKVATTLPLLRVLRSRLRQRLYKAAGSTDYLESGTMKQIFLNAINEDLLPAAAKINLPTLLIWGRNDTVTPLKNGQLMTDTIKGSEMLVVEGAGHYPFIDKPAEVAGVIEEFTRS